VPVRGLRWLYAQASPVGGAAHRLRSLFFPFLFYSFLAWWWPSWPSSPASSPSSSPTTARPWTWDSTS